MDFAEIQLKTGFRLPFNYFPNTKNLALKLHIPLGFFLSPFLADSFKYSVTAPRCSKCGSSVGLFSPKNKAAKKWTCQFCNTDNSLMIDVGNYVVQEYIQSKQGETGLFFVIDLAMPQKQLTGLKNALLNTIQKLPQNIFVGLITFSRTVNLCDFSSEKNVRFFSLNGNKQYTPTAIQQQLGISIKNDPRAISNLAISNYFVSLEKNKEKLIKCIESLQSDSFPFGQNDRQQRATGCALNVAISVIETTGINARIALLVSGPCTIGPGQVVSIPLQQTMRSFIDIHQNNENAKFMKPAKKFYESIEKRLISKHTLDIWAYGLDQFGLLQMKDLAIKTGGLIGMHELFNHFIFENSFSLHYQANEAGLFKFPIASKLSLFISKQMRINGIIGHCKSLKDDKLNLSSDMIIGEGQTNQWYIGGLQSNSALSVFISNADSAKQDVKQCFIQAVTVFKYSDNIIRVKVANVMKQFIRQSQIKEFPKSFDQQAAIILLARLASYKGEIQQVSQVKKWLDRVLLKFIVRFGIYNKYNVNSFRLNQSLKLFPQYTYHLRRSSIINTFGCSPDESIFHSSCLQRQSISNCIVMIQPALIMYSVDDPAPKTVELDLCNMKDDVILLLDSYFNVLIWYGDHIYKWKVDKLNESEDYAYLDQLFQAPLSDSSQIMYDRVPVPNFYETFKGDGKERYLKSRVNPSTNQNSGQTETGNFVSDDAPIKIFMDYLIKSVVNYAD